MLRIRELRKQKGLNQEGLAMRINVSQSTVSAYEMGERIPDLETFIRLADLFGVSLDYLAGLSDVKLRLRQSDLSHDEIEHLHSFRRLNTNDRGEATAYIDGMLENVCPCISRE